MDTYWMGIQPGLAWILFAMAMGSGLFMAHGEAKGIFGMVAKIVLGLSLALGAIGWVNDFSSTAASSGNNTSLTGVTATVTPSTTPLPWDSIFSEIENDLSGNVARWGAVVAIVIAGLFLAFGEGGTMIIGRAKGSSGAWEDRTVWEAELAEMVRKDQGVKGIRNGFRFLPVSLRFLPEWWPARHGAWSYMHFILLGPGLSGAPKPVKRYVLGHELGHIRHGHTSLNYLFTVAAIGFLPLYWLSMRPGIGTAPVAAVALLLMASKSTLLFFPRKREYQADRHSLGLVGQKDAIEGSLWMAHHNHDMTPLRRERLRRLGWNPATAGDDEKPSHG